MSVLKPDFRFKKITDISLEDLKKLNVKAVFLDVDNTLCSYKSKVPLDGAIEWTKKVKAAGYKTIIVSNNFEKRVSAVAKIYDMDYISFALKPFPRGFSKAAKNFSLAKSECLIIGDQIFTDILGGNLALMKTVLVEPVELEEGIIFKVRRKIENKLKRKIKFEKD